MSRIAQAFQGKTAFMPFITGGDPGIETTEKLLYALVEAGADIIEIGVPFSDPVAEGPVIEAANERALSNGCTVDQLFALVKRVRASVNIPLLFMSYYNPIFAYGVAKFTANCVDCGLDGLIVPDLPFEERDELLGPCQAQGLELISLIAPTSEDRIAAIAQNSSGFLYCVSSLGTTGERNALHDHARRMIANAKQASGIACAVGFGVSTPEQASAVAAYADGVIVGSAIVRLVGEHGRDCVAPVMQFAKSLKQAITN